MQVTWVSRPIPEDRPSDVVIQPTTASLAPALPLGRRRAGRPHGRRADNDRGARQTLADWHLVDHPGGLATQGVNQAAAADVKKFR